MVSLDKLDITYLDFPVYSALNNKTNHPIAGRRGKGSRAQRGGKGTLDGGRSGQAGRTQPVGVKYTGTGAAYAQAKISIFRR